MLEHPVLDPPSVAAESLEHLMRSFSVPAPQRKRRPSDDRNVVGVHVLEVDLDVEMILDGREEIDEADRVDDAHLHEVEVVTDLALRDAVLREGARQVVEDKSPRLSSRHNAHDISSRIFRSARRSYFPFSVSGSRSIEWNLFGIIYSGSRPASLFLSAAASTGAPSMNASMPSAPLTVGGHPTATTPSIPRFLAQHRRFDLAELDRGCRGSLAGNRCVRGSGSARCGTGFLTRSPVR